MEPSAQATAPRGPDRGQQAAVNAAVVLLEATALLSSSPAPHIAAAGLLVLGFRTWLDRSGSGR